MPIKLRTYFSVLLLLACSSGMAQLTSSYSFSSLSFGNGTLVSTESVMINSTVKCLSISNGISTMQVSKNGTGVFGASCNAIPPVAPTVFDFSMSLSVYPNPTKGMSILKAKGQFDQDLSCMVRVMSIDGKMMMSQMVPMREVVSGYSINANAYAPGKYIVSVEFMGQRYNMTLVKIY